MDRIKQLVETIVKCIAMVSIVIEGGVITKCVLVLVQLVALLRSYGLPSMNTGYTNRIMASEFTSNIFYLLVTSSLNSYLFYFPLFI